MGLLIRILAATAGISLVASAGSPQSSPAREKASVPYAPARVGARPNILWIIAEDMSPDLGAYGNRDVRTPHVDALAREGQLYTHAFTTAPICSPSRSAFMTGMYQTTIGAMHHRSHRNDGYALPAGVRVLPDWLRDGGYATANVVDLTGQGKAAPFYKGTGKTDWNFDYTASSGRAKPFDLDKWSDLKARQPFYAQVNLAETHRLMSDWKADGNIIPARADPAKITIPPYYPDDNLTRTDWADYLNAVMAMDMKVGFILDKLKADGLADDTIVIFIADHGQAHVRGKQWAYDSGLRIPLIVRWPKNFPAPAGYRAGGRSDRMIEAIDLAATSLWAAGLPIPQKMQGRPFLGPLTTDKRYAFGARDRADEAEERIRTVRDARYRYIRNLRPELSRFQRQRYKEDAYPVFNHMKALHAENRLGVLGEAQFVTPKAPEELYDLQADPYEVRNLASDRKYAAVKARLAAALTQWESATNDQGRVPEHRREVDFWTRRVTKEYGN